MLIITVLNSRSANFNIPAMYECGSDACSVSSNCFLPFSMPCNFLLKAGHDILGRRNASKETFGDVVVRCRGRGGVLWSCD